MKNQTKIILGTLLLAATLPGSGWAQQTEPDNTRVNRQPQTTADQAKNGKTDLTLMREIRRAVVKDKSLSTYAHNVKIVSKDGKVTLTGPVRSEEEKKAVEDKATEAAGAGNVIDQLTVKTK